MKNDCKLIGTLPSLHDKKAVHEMMSSDYISEVRLNSGVNDLLTPEEVIERIKVIEKMYKKTVWIDLKGRQLRVNAWADPSYEAVELNHEIEIEYPAKIIFRGSNSSNIMHTKGNKIVLDTPPERAVGKGQSVNIIAKSLNIKGFLTPQDIELIKHSKELGLNNYMASFVENEEDLVEILKLNKEANIICKIESKNGMKFINDTSLPLHLMAARDDLYTETGRNILMMTIFLPGMLYPSDWRALTVRSKLSLTAVSPSPTRWIPIPLRISTSTVTVTASMPMHLAQ